MTLPPWLVVILLKYVLPLIITWLQKAGYINAAEALLDKGAVAVYAEIKNLKFYDQYPGDPPPPPTTTNLTTKDGTPVT